MLKSVGASGQLSLGKKYAGQYFFVEVVDGGALLLKPMKVVPAAEAWVHEPDMRARLAVADAWMEKHPPAESNLESLLKIVDSRRKAAASPVPTRGRGKATA